MNVMLLAAGLGTRLRPFTEKVPKPAIPFLGIPLGYYPLALLDEIKIEKLVVNTHHLPEQIEQLYRALGKKAIFSNESPSILGSGGGIRQALPHLLGQGSFLVANADEIILPEQPYLIKEALQFHNWHKGIATLVAMPHPSVGTKFGGIWGQVGVDGSFRVQEFSKTNVPNLQGLHFLGVMIFKDSIANYFSKDTATEENILYETLTSAMLAGEQVYAYSIPQTHWFETGNPTDFLQAERVCANAILADEPWTNLLKVTLNLFNSQSQRSFLLEAEEASLQELIQKVWQKLGL